jgi:hypothetical protein
MQCCTLGLVLSSWPQLQQQAFTKTTERITCAATTYFRLSNVNRL